MEVEPLCRIVIDDEGVLFPVLFVVATVLLKHIRSILIALAGYVALLLLYMDTVGPVQDWLALWSGGYAPEVALLGLFFLVVLLVVSAPGTTRS